MLSDEVFIPGEYGVRIVASISVVSSILQSFPLSMTKSPSLSSLLPETNGGGKAETEAASGRED